MKGLSSVHKKAKIGSNASIQPFAYIEEDVVIGDNCWIGPNTTIMNGARLGDNVRVFPGAVVSAPTQELRDDGKTYSQVIIGNGTTVRECCTLNRGINPEIQTQIGENCLLMAYVHIAHDCVLGNRVVLANNVNLAGHIEIGNFATLGGLTAVHQFVRIGEQVMIGGGSLVRKDVPPFVMAAREPLCYVGINRTGLHRRGFSQAEINHIEGIYRYLFVKGYPVKDALQVIEANIEPSKFRDAILNFVRESKRGMMKGFRSMNTGGGKVGEAVHD